VSTLAAWRCEPKSADNLLAQVLRFHGAHIAVEAEAVGEDLKDALSGASGHLRFNVQAPLMWLYSSQGECDHGHDALCDGYRHHARETHPLGSQEGAWQFGLT